MPSPEPPARNDEPPGSAVTGEDAARVREARGLGRVLRHREGARAIPWWGRLAFRVFLIVTFLGTITVGASFYIARLTVATYEGLVSRQAQLAETAVGLASPLYQHLAAASRRAFAAEAKGWLLELENVEATEHARREWLTAKLAATSDVVRLEYVARDLQMVEVEREEGDGIVVEVIAALEPGAIDEDGPKPPSLTARFEVPANIDAQFQRLGAVRRNVGVIALESGEVVDREEFGRATVRAVTAASVLVLAIAFAVGIILTRSTTRRVSDMSKVMDRISRGDLGARAPRLGEDELGRLAADFNGMLDELDVARDRLAYLERIAAWQEMARRIAHEIKNPLTPIQLAVQQIREKDPGTDPRFTRLVRDSAEIVEDEIAGLRRMVTSFSQFARVPEVQLERVELRRVVEEFVRAYGHLTDRDEDALEFEATDTAVDVDGDRQLLKQVLVNLVENAVLSAKEASVTPIRVRVSVDVQGARARILVDDNGPGIAATRRERVFEPYETTRSEGTGLGLAIVKKIILDHAGTVRAEESPLGGARFVIELPRARATPSPRRRTAPPVVS